MNMDPILRGHKAQETCPSGLKRKISSKNVEEEVDEQILANKMKKKKDNSNVGKRNKAIDVGATRSKQDIDKGRSMQDRAKEREKSKKDTVIDKSGSKEVIKRPSQQTIRKRGAANRFTEINKTLSDGQKYAIAGIGFGGLLRIKCPCVPERLSFWLINIFDLQTSELVVPFRGSIKVDEDAVHRVLGLPQGQENIVYKKLASTETFKCFEKDFVHDEDYKAPTIVEVENYLIGKGKGDTSEIWLRKWLLYAINIVLCPTTSSKLSVRGCHAIFDISAVVDFNWCKLVLEQLRKDIMEYKSHKKQPAFGCLIFLVILYLDSLQVDIDIDQDEDIRASVWTKTLVDKVIEMDKVTDATFGKLKIKQEVAVRARPMLVDPTKVVEFVNSTIPPNCTEEMRVNVMNVLSSFSAGIIQTAINLVKQLTAPANDQAIQGDQVHAKHDQGGINDQSGIPAVSTMAASVCKRRRRQVAAHSEDEFEDVEIESDKEVEETDEDSDDDDYRIELRSKKKHDVQLIEDDEEESLDDFGDIDEKDDGDDDQNVSEEDDHDDKDDKSAKGNKGEKKHNSFSDAILGDDKMFNVKCARSDNEVAEEVNVAHEDNQKKSHSQAHFVHRMSKDKDVSEQNTSLQENGRGTNEFGISSQENHTSDIHICPFPDFHNFEDDRSCEKIEYGQIWALYSDYDCFPSFYGWISKVKREPFRVDVAWLGACTQLEQEKRWLDQEIPISCGTFKVERNSTTTYDTNLVFSHLLDVRKTSPKWQYEIHPKIGEIWAIYMNWAPDWVPSDNNGRAEYAIGMIRRCTKSGTVFEFLTKVGGYTAVFKPNKQKRTLQIPTKENLRFSHRIPSFRLTDENYGNLCGFYELDPAAVPDVFL